MVQYGGSPDFLFTVSSVASWVQEDGVLAGVEEQGEAVGEDLSDNHRVEAWGVHCIHVVALEVVAAYREALPGVPLLQKVALLVACPLEEALGGPCQVVVRSAGSVPCDEELASANQGAWLQPGRVAALAGEQRRPLLDWRQ